MRPPSTPPLCGGNFSLPADRGRVKTPNPTCPSKGGSSNGWSLFGLAQALDMQGRTAEAAQVRLELDDAWARSDTWLRGSKF